RASDPARPRPRGPAQAARAARAGLSAGRGERRLRGEPRRRARARAGEALNLGRVGVWSSAPSVAPAAVVREWVREVEALGYPTVWYPEGGGKECFSVGALLLAWSERLVVATGIQNIHARDPMAAANGARALA